MEKQYYATIGLEIHAELNTKSKMFCSCKNDPDEENPNINICPVCMAHPGTLPVPNIEAIQKVIQVGLALGSDIADFTEFDRKNYFYPDIPKGYQISQYKFPIVSGGKLNDFAITRIHLEEDTGLSKHDRGDFSLVDYNRAGVPLMELVTEPVLHSAVDAANFARELQLLLRTLGVSDANLEKGEMRVEPNISISDNPDVFGTKVEVKNLNSFKTVEKAIAYELARMQALYEAGRQNEIVQETRGWDEIKQSTFSQRSKENANDYRYFPDPDIPKFYLSKMFDMESLRANLAELPAQKRARYAKEFGLKDADIEFFVQDKKLADYFETITKGKDSLFAQTTANYIITDALGRIAKDANLKLPSEADFGALITLIVENKITSRGAKDILGFLLQGETDPISLAETHGLVQQNNTDALIPIIQGVVDAQSKIVADYKAGKEAALQALLGMVMKETKGAANPGIAMQILKDLLK
ncbi:MAG: Asp-tRNA(Asn)/Glu-tRNA(Gln) amidotransferase subunit GatB [bacterium]